MTTYTSPFGVLSGVDHNGPDALCLSRTHCTNAVEETLHEFYLAAQAAIDSRAPQPAFFLARQLAELACKALLGPGAPATHDMAKLLECLGAQGDDLLKAGAEQELIVEFIRDLDQHDRIGDQGRYPTTRNGSPALANVCCADPTLLSQHIDRLHGYVQNRLQRLVATL
jgi:HEPN domain-containing protein